MFKEDVLKGKKILVTGGGTGLGKEMSEHYVQHGADVVICGRRESVLAETATEFKEKYGADVRYQPLDIRSPQDVEDFIELDSSSKAPLGLSLAQAPSVGNGPGAIAFILIP